MRVAGSDVRRAPCSEEEKEGMNEGKDIMNESELYKELGSLRIHRTYTKTI